MYHFWKKSCPYWLTVSQGNMRAWRLSRITRFLVILGMGTVWKGASLDDYSLHTINGLCPEPIIHDIVADGKPLSLEVDARARLSIISHDTYMKLWYCQPPTLHPSKDWLRTSTGEVIQVEGIVDVVVQDRNRVMHTLPLVVVPDSRHSLLGLNWLTKGPVDWPDAHACRHAGFFTESQFEETSSDTRRQQGNS